ncbi:VanZ family protein [Bariatricus massiliensis]|uniref:VanZ family protein n=2 Tax=Bariatricus massiliensis TaxID=1745713 RepID=A0ABS8DDH0_9FIRM|nr:VanZ family protein [Bariatricus massiliensis]MCB7302574.1 VanZ family protein [Bariatricus massiliensis]MCB7373790.1 VanZ family protein [Bariatricus massiliensis]MCB7386460.1 VanZ family protein [Bariatricus massiliensis]MCB7410622.1 VanZ family protein [Bariatricus massiliensis]MCQ5253541.1 VanZ family protein [Bariatricus massiliensis]
MKAKNRKRVRMLGKILFILYIGFLLYFLIFSDWYGRTGGMNEYHYNLVLFKEIKRFWIYREQLGWVSFANLFGNVLIFMPFGFFMPMASRYRSFFLTLFYSFGLSLLVETFQLFTKVGSFDVDDLLLNTIGGVIGYIFFVICNTIRRWHDANRAGKRAGSRKR